MSRFRVCFLGTPPFAEAHLRALLLHPEFEIVGVVTQPDRPAGRKMQLTPSKVKLTALEKNLKVLTPENLRKEEIIFNEIKSWKADVAVVVAFGQILSQEFLDSFPFGAVGWYFPSVFFKSDEVRNFMKQGDQESIRIQVAVHTDAMALAGMRMPIIPEHAAPLPRYGELNFIRVDVVQHRFKTPGRKVGFQRRKLYFFISHYFFRISFDIAATSAAR